MEKDKKKKPAADLSGFKIEVNEFGQIVRNRPVEDVIEFLDENVEDLKLAERPDYVPPKKKND